jgi:hypothetical protein
MNDDPWYCLTNAPDAPSAHALVAELAADGVAARIVADTVLLGEARQCKIFVRRSQVHRARWLVSDPCFTDEELACLAIGLSKPGQPEVPNSEATGTSATGGASAEAKSRS